MSVSINEQRHNTRIRVKHVVEYTAVDRSAPEHQSNPTPRVASDTLGVPIGLIRTGSAVLCRDGKVGRVAGVITHTQREVLSGCWPTCRERQNPCDTSGMKPSTTAAPYKGHRFPQEIISHAVWLYHRFSLSYRDVEELLAERGIVVTYETVRQWCLKFGQQYANQ